MDRFRHKALSRRMALGGALALLAGRAAAGGSAMTEPRWSAPELDWSFLADTVMGGVSEGRAVLEGGAVRLIGTVSTENQGGFLQVRADVRVPPEATGLRIEVRGNGQRYFLHLRTSRTVLPWQFYQAGFDASEGWATVDIPFTAFERKGSGLFARLSPEDIRSVGLAAYGRDHQADVSLRRLTVI